MFECSQCGRQTGDEILGCPQGKDHSCSYRVNSEQTYASKLQGFLFIFLGALLLISVISFPLTADVFMGNTVSGAIVRTLIFSIFLLAGGFVIFIGWALSFSRIVTVYSKEDGNLFQTYYFNSYQYRTRLIENLRQVECNLNGIAAEGLGKASLLSLRPLSETRSIYNFYKNQKNRKSDEAERKHNQLIELANRAVVSALCNLLSRGLIKLSQGVYYESRVKDVDQTEETPINILIPGKLTPERINGKLERRFLHMIRNWPDQSAGSRHPLGPTLAQLISETFSYDIAAAAADIIECVIFENEDQPNISLAEAQIKPENGFSEEESRIIAVFKLFQEQNPGLYRVIKREVENALPGDFTKARDLGGINLFDGVYLKYLRIGLVVMTLLFFTVGRYLTGIHNVRNVKQYIESIPGKSSAISRKAGNLFGSKDMDFGTVSDKLANWLKDPEKHLRKLLNLTESRQVEIRRQIAKKLSELNDYSNETIKALTKLLHDSDMETRRYAIAALERAGSLASSAVPDLVGLLKGSDPLTAALSARALGKIGSYDSEGVISALGEAITNGNPMLTEFAAEALRQIGTDDALLTLDEAVRRQGSNKYLESTIPR